MTHIVANLQAERIGELNAIVLDRTIITTNASTTVLTAVSPSQYIFTGSTVGTTIRLPNATTLLPGLTYTFWNQSTVPITIKLNDTTTTLFTVTGGEQTTTVLQDNTTTNGTWIYAKRSSSATSAMPIYFGQTTTTANIYLFEGTSSKTTTDVLSPPFARNAAIVGYAFNCTAFTVGKSMIIRSGLNLGVDKAKIDLVSQPQSGWNNAGYTTFAAGDRPAIYLKRNTRQRVTATPDVTSQAPTQHFIQTINGTPYDWVYTTTEQISVTWTRTNNQTYTVVINGVTCTYTSDSTATDAEISAGLSSAINTNEGTVVTATNAKPMIVTADTVGADFTYSGTNVTITNLTPSTTTLAVCNGLRALMAADPYVSVSGTTTLIMTGPVNGDSFTYSGSANLTEVLGTPVDDGLALGEVRFVMYYVWTD